MEYFENHVMKDVREDGRINLQRKRLVKLPPGYQAAARLPYVHFDLSYNDALSHSTVIDELTAIPQLQGLTMIQTALKELPDNIARLQNLAILDISENKLSGCPDVLAALKQLRVLHLEKNKLTAFPVFSQPMEKLEALYIGNNTLCSLPQNLSVLPSLKILDVSNVHLIGLPQALTTLPHLETLVLDGNTALHMDEVFQLLAGCKTLKRLSIRNCGITKLPDSFKLLQQLVAIDVRGNGLTSLPEMPNITEIECDWRLPAPFYINMIKDRPDITSFSQSKIERYYNNRKETLPDNIAALQYVTSFTFSELEELPAATAGLTQAKDIFFYNGNYHTLPDLSGLMNLEKLSFVGTRVAVFPEFVYQLPALKCLVLADSNVRPDYERISGMPALETLTATRMTDEELQPFLQPVNGRYINVALIAAPLPAAFYDLPCVESFDFNSRDQLNLDETMLHLKRLPHLKKLVFRSSDRRSFATYINWLKEMTVLRDVTLYVDEQQVPASLAELTHLDKIRLEWSEGQTAVPDLPLTFGNTPAGQIVLEKKSYTAAYLHAFEQLSLLNLEEPLLRMIAFGLLARRYDALKELLPGPFDAAGQLPDARVYITGQSTIGSRKELAAILEARGARVVKELEEATHVYLGLDVTTNAVKQIIHLDLGFILEDHLKQLEIKDLAPFLMQEENKELTAQVTRLLKTKEENDMWLLLEMVRGGGANKKLLSYLVAIHLFHSNKEIALQAKILFRQYASAALQHHIRITWKDEYTHKKEDAYSSVYLHPELDVFAFLLVVKIIKNGIPFLYLPHIPDHAVTDSLKDLDFIRVLYIDSPRNGELSRLLNSIQDMELDQLKITAPLATLPVAVWTMPTLTNISLDLKEVSGFTVPVLDNADVPVLHLTITKGKILHPERLAACRQLISLTLSDGGLETADFLTTMCKLDKLDLENNKLTTLPEGLSQLKELRELTITGNEITESDVDALILKGLIYLNHKYLKRK
ncbi:leucine-rich repeat domain-containing protein [Chitinophaga flava]|uniref:BRCT domain-containing protein n=1 Tax=Chitinophaga flava TaxID=2259036 RepID=A0A365XPH0_9BACT|nr:hypothetical protein [Chitinophaga flava]RBL88217.1 hypothetical protein DF182_16590 [Chitinophaga flava]